METSCIFLCLNPYFTLVFWFSYEHNLKDSSAKQLDLNSWFFSHIVEAAFIIMISLLGYSVPIIHIFSQDILSDPLIPYVLVLP